MNTLYQLIEALRTLPDYFGKGVLTLLVTTVGGIIVAWFTTKYFSRRSEINVVEATLLKRKLDIYEELTAKLELLKDMVIISSDVQQEALKGLGNLKFNYNVQQANQLFKIFCSPQDFTNEFLAIDKYIATKRLYFDEQVQIQTLCLMNYLGCIRRLLVMYEEQFIDLQIPLEQKIVLTSERILITQLGIILQQELSDQIDKVVSTIKVSIQNLSFAHREELGHTYDYYNSPDGPIMSQLMGTTLFTQREEIKLVVTKAVAMGLAGLQLRKK